LESQDVTTRSPAYQAFSGWLKANPDKQDEYKQIRGPGASVKEEKKAFRLRWAEMKIQDSIISKVKKEEWQEVETEAGTYEPFDRIVFLEGNTQAAVEAAMKYVSKAIQMGGPWVAYNEMTERTDVLYVKKSHKKIFSRLWGLYCEQASAAPKATSTDPSSGSTSLDTPLKGSKATPKAKRPVSEVCAAPHEEAREKAAKKAKLDLFRKASATKNLYLKLKSVHAQILSNIQGDASYAWANNAGILDRLSTVESEVNEFVCGYPFNKFFLVHDPSEVKKVYGDDISSHLNRFCTELGDGLGKLSKEHQRFNRMHLANRSP
jgi:hypothetical protein